MADVSVGEGTGTASTATFTVSLSHAKSFPVSVTYQTMNETAVSPSDYEAAVPTTLAFAAGVSSRTVNVRVEGDVVDEANETFALRLSTPFDATIADDHGVATIVDDDAAPAVTTGGAASIGETTATLGGTVNANGRPTTVYFEYGQTTAYGTQTAVQPGGSGTTGQAVSASVSGLTPGTTYHFRLVGTSNAGTTFGADQTFTTAGVAPDTTPPSAVSVAPTGSTQSSVTFGWTAATDNVGVTGYDVFIGATKVATVATPGYTAGGLTCGQSVTIGVEAFDAAGHRGQRSMGTGSASACPPPPSAPATTPAPTGPATSTPATTRLHDRRHPGRRHDHGHPR